MFVSYFCSQGGAVLDGGMMYFTINPAAAAKTFEFVLQSTAGDADLYINANATRPTLNASDYSSAHALATDSVKITDLDVVFKDKPRVFTVGVYGYYASAFSLTAASDLVIQRLQAGAAVYETAVAGEKNHYLIEVDGESTAAEPRDLEFSITAFSGTVVMYGSANSSNTRPNEAAHDKKAVGYNSNSFTFSNASNQVCRRTNKAVLSRPRYHIIFISESFVYHFHSQYYFLCYFVAFAWYIRPSQAYYVSVECSTPCYYSLLAGFSGRIALTDGVAQSSTLRPGARRTFLLTTPHHGDAAKDVTFSLLPLSSAPLTAYIKVGSAPSTTAPDADTLVIAETSSQAAAVVDKAMLSQTRCGTAPDCRVFMVVVASPAAAQEAVDVTFTVTAATQSATVTLQDGVPVRSAVTAAANTAYFSFYANLPKGDIGVTVTPVSAGSTSFMMVYLSATQRYPNATAEWRSDFYQTAPYVHIDDSTPGYVTEGHNYYLAVTATSEVVFTVTLTLTPLDSAEAQSVLLLPGRPQSSLVQAGGWRYYRFRSGADAAVTFTIIPSYGDPDLYANKNGTRPTEEAADKKSTQLGGDQIIYTAADGCANCWYDVAVKGWGKSLFTIVAQTASQVLELQSGLPITNTLEAGDNKYYYQVRLKRDTYHFFQN